MMAELYEMLSARYGALPDDLMQLIAEEAAPGASMKKRGKTYTYTWPDLKIRIKVMSPRKLSA